MPQEVKIEPGLGGGAGAVGAAVPVTLQGWAVDMGDPAMTLEVLEKAFDFRGDCTITGADGREVTGYIFDRKRGAGLGDSYVRLMTAESDEKVKIGYDAVRRVSFGKDAAHGKTFENWVKRYVETKMKGERASIEAEELG